MSCEREMGVAPTVVGPRVWLLLGALACVVALAACRARRPDPAPTAASLPDEPWYRDRPEHTDECVTPLATRPPAHFPAPFDFCDPRSESHTSPPGQSELHFRYRSFSVELTKTRRAGQPGVCCYMVYEFPRP